MTAFGHWLVLVDSHQEQLEHACLIKAINRQCNVVDFAAHAAAKSCSGTVAGKIG